MTDLDFENRCVKCRLSTHCPIGRRPIGLLFEYEGFKFTCENLVELYEIFRTIGGMKREYHYGKNKKKDKHDQQ